MYVYRDIYVYIYISSYAYTQTYIYTYTHTHTHTHTHAHICTYAYPYIPLYIICIYIYTYICKSKGLPSSRHVSDRSYLQKEVMTRSWDSCWAHFLSVIRHVCVFCFQEHERWQYPHDGWTNKTNSIQPKPEQSSQTRFCSWISNSILTRTQTHTTPNPNTHNHSNPRTHWHNVRFSTISTGNGPTGGVSHCDTLFVLNYIYCFEKGRAAHFIFFSSFLFPRRLTSGSSEGGPEGSDFEGNRVFSGLLDGPEKGGEARWRAWKEGRAGQRRGRDGRAPPFLQQKVKGCKMHGAREGRRLRPATTWRRTGSSVRSLARSITQGDSATVGRVCNDAGSPCSEMRLLQMQMLHALVGNINDAV